MIFTYLQRITVRNNVIHNMSIDAFYGLKNLKRIHLEQCRLRRMPPIVQVKDSLQSLLIIGNKIAHIPECYFHGLRQFTTLSLAENCLTQFPDVSPVHQTLFTLSLRSNYISEIPHFMVDNIFISLKSLMLSNNKIYKLTSSFLSNIPNLQELFILNNRLHTLDESVFGGTHTAMVVILAGNPWRCDSALAWLCDLPLSNYSLRVFFKQYRTYGHTGVTDYGRLKCAGPDVFAGIDIMHLCMFQLYIHIFSYLINARINYASYC